MEILLKLISLSILFLILARPFYTRRAVLENKSGYNEDFYHFVTNSYAGLLSAIFAKVASADGRVSEKEAVYVSSFLNGLAKDFSADKEIAREILRSIFHSNKQSSENYEDLVKSLYVLVASNKELKERSIQLLMGLAYIDNDFSDEEDKLLRSIASIMGFNESEYLRIKDVITEQYDEHKECIKNHYKTLGVDQSASDESVKKAYRVLVKKYHPDTVADISQEQQDEYNEKLKEINEAYDKIKRMRSM